jgi:hypothetical protein
VLACSPSSTVSSCVISSIRPGVRGLSRLDTRYWPPHHRGTHPHSCATRRRSPHGGVCARATRSG